MVGYYTLAAGSASRNQSAGTGSQRIRPRPPFQPFCWLGWPWTTKRRERGSAKGLLEDVRSCGPFRRHNIVGCRAVMVHAKDYAARAFYLRFGFEASPADPFRLFR